MKWLRTLVLFDQGEVMRSRDWETIHASYTTAIASIDHVEGSGTLTLRRKVRLPDSQWRRNGVVYLRSRFVGHFAGGWLESRRDRQLGA